MCFDIHSRPRFPAANLGRGPSDMGGCMQINGKNATDSRTHQWQHISFQGSLNFRPPGLDAGCAVLGLGTNRGMDVLILRSNTANRGVENEETIKEHQRLCLY